ncbi:MAG: ACP S-malonyltransferase [Woeseiaceae bacterium]|jgi:[acyl-carrier-protein] S-malonyltransferase|nr:ACP S-malonyltransferase [Woeseiaceae bacterium]
MSNAMIFPGQGSQSVGMQSDLAANFSLVQETYEEASEVLGYDLWNLVQNGPIEQLNKTVITQPAMLTAGVAAYRVWLAEGGSTPHHVAGHSLGEYTALVAAESFSFSGAMRVVIERAQQMQNAVPANIGAMAAIIGLDDSEVIAACDEATSGGIVEPVNFNSPNQVVIAGHKEAVNDAMYLCEKAGARRVMLLPVSVPSHSSLMTDAGKKLQAVLSTANIKTPVINTIAATDGQPYNDADDIRSRLSRQVYGPVHWVKTVKFMIEAGATTIIECGPGKVLTGLCRRINRNTSVSFIDSVDSLQKSLIA